MTHINLPYYVLLIFYTYLHPLSPTASLGFSISHLILPVDHPSMGARMAPNLAASTLSLIHDMILGRDLTAPQMAEAAGCNERTTRRLK